MLEGDRSSRSESSVAWIVLWQSSRQKIMSELKQFGKDLRHLINSPKVFSLLRDGDWGAGGCWQLAAALVEFMGPPAEMWAIKSTGGLEDLVEHVVVKYDALYIDYNGAQTKKELEKNISKDPHYRGRVLEMVKFGKKLQGQARAQGYIPCDIGIVRDLKAALFRAFPG